MSFEIDHLFICTDINAPEADRLVSFGLTEGTPNVHPGQGTANRRFFFHNCMLELLWISDRNEAQSEITRPTYFWERWRDRHIGTCPFGFCLRPTTDPPNALPFLTWAYRPAYLPDSLSFSMATNASVLTEPMLCYLPFAKRQDSYTDDRRQPMNHIAGLNEMTRLTFVSPHADRLSPELQAMVNSNFIQLKHGKNYLVEMGFNGEKQENYADFQPGLPLSLSW
ncbi:MAG: VOC family protein [Cyanosarcina radialis HA8281-LM2]|nr:VOC family protein [Cyanosarcina radialis HA8281-LM2]